MAGRAARVARRVTLAAHPRERRRLRTWDRLAAADRDQCYELLVCGVFRNEAPYLREWIEFHRLVGADKFTLFNNFSTDDYAAVLTPYVEAGIVTLFDFPCPPAHVQVDAYNACLARYREQARWIAFLDIDEFLYPVEIDSLPTFLAGYAEAPALAVHWLLFNASGHILRPPGLVTENFTHCQVGGNKWVKVVVDPKRTEGFRLRAPHNATYAGGRYAVNEAGEEVVGQHRRPAVTDRIRINHYYTKSVEEFFLRKVSRGQVSGSPALDHETLLRSERNYGTGVDTSIQRFLPALRARVGPGDAG